MTEITEAGWARLSKSKNALNLETDDGKSYTLAFARIDKLRQGVIQGARFSSFERTKQEEEQ